LNTPNCFKLGTIIVFGISGVGKSTACASYVARHPNVLHTSAGALLQEARGIDSGALRTEAARSVIENQALLVAAFTRFRLGRETADILIDAHSVIDNDRELVEVPVEIVQALNPSGLILLEASPEVILERRQRGLRARPARSVEELKTEMAASRTACEKYAADLNLPLEIGILANEQDLDTLIDRVVSREGSN
jgi:adenylate kinase